MDSRSRDRSPSDDAIEFVRFCYRRKRVGWPELYDEMCAVAGRGLFRGWSSDELSAEGIGFSLFEMQNLALLVHRVIAEEQERRTQIAAAAVIRPAGVDAATALEDAAVQASVADDAPESAATPPLRFLGAAAGA
ncbi:MAG: hypothetical protein M3067_15350 [Chloroflexota bacterium]|nr:hypothetical protein [Chloroflexota bacterium]